MAQAWNMTEAEAHTLLELIGRTGTGEHTEEGVSFRTVQALYAGIRPGIPRVNVPSIRCIASRTLPHRRLTEKTSIRRP